MSKVSQEKVDTLLADMKEKLPDYKIIYKDEPLPKVWYVRFIMFMASLWGFFNRGFRKAWNTRISNGIGDYIIFPSRETHGDLRDFKTYMILRHEYVHLLDSKKYGLWFQLTYGLLPLPILLSGRAHWELRGYSQNLIVLHEEGRTISDKYLDSVASQFWKPLYFWMYPFPGSIKKKLRKIRDGIEAGEIKGFNPDIKLWD